MRSRQGEGIKWKQRSECMRWWSLWGEIFPLRGAVLRSLIFEQCCDARQEYSRATTAATGKKKKNPQQLIYKYCTAEESAEEAAGDKPAPLDECYLHNVTGSTSCEQTFRPAKRSIAGSQSHMLMAPLLESFPHFCQQRMKMVYLFAVLIMNECKRSGLLDSCYVKITRKPRVKGKKENRQRFGTGCCCYWWDSVCS